MLQSKGFDPRIFSVEGQYANHYTMEPSVTVVISKIGSSLFIIAFAEFGEFIGNAS